MFRKGPNAIFYFLSLFIKTQNGTLYHIEKYYNLTYFRAGFLHINTALHTLDYLDKEQEYIPWGAAIKELSYLDRMLVSRPAYGNFEVT